MLHLNEEMLYRILKDERCRDTLISLYNNYKETPSIELADKIRSTLFEIGKSLGIHIFKLYPYQEQDIIESAEEFVNFYEENKSESKRGFLYKLFKEG